MEIQQLKAFIKEIICELEEEIRLCYILIPYISDDEQSEIEAEFDVPSKYADDEVVDLTDWQ